MGSTVGVRIYKLTLHEKSKRTELPFSFQGAVPPPQFVSDFISQHSVSNTDADLERSWWFEQKETQPIGNSKGYVRYGTYGFESNFVDIRTKKSNYKRKTTDVEEIPLYYEFWTPPNSGHILVAFQSFQGRSCIRIVMQKMLEKFEAGSPNFIIKFKKIIPNDPSGSMSRASVKKFTLVKRNIHSDLADKYLSSRPARPVDFEVAIKAKRQGSLGAFGDIVNSIRKDDAGLVVYDGLAFDEGSVEVRLGGRLRRVGVFGISSDVGVIDLTDAIRRGADGHPTFESMVSETKTLDRDSCHSNG